MKRMLSLLLTLSLLFSSPFFVLALPSDTPSEWAQAEVDAARSKNLVLDEANGNFQANITRRLFCALVVNMVENVLGDPVAVTIVNPFLDTREEAIIKAYQLGIVNGISATEFAPDAQITREQIAVMMMRGARKIDELQRSTYAYVPTASTVSFADQGQISAWALQDVQAASVLGIMKGVGENKINPLGNTTVEQSILLITRMYDGFVPPESIPLDPTPIEPIPEDPILEPPPEDPIPETPPEPVENQAPVAIANPVQFTTQEQTALVIQASQLVIDVNNDTLTIARVNGQTNSYNTVNGTVTLQSDGSITYTSRDITANVSDDFVVSVSDGTLLTHVNVRVNVTYTLVLVFKPSLSSVGVNGSPVIDETLSVGLLSYVGGVPSPAPTLTYQWYKGATTNGVYSPILGATSSSYKVLRADLNNYLKVKVTASGSAGGSIYSAPVGLVGYGFSGGLGTEANPYQIETAKQFMLLNSVPTVAKYFVLNNDITLDENSYIATTFYGSLNGQYHTVNIDLTQSLDTLNVALFSIIGKTSDFTSSIQKLRVAGILDTTATRVGGLIGLNNGLVRQCNSYVTVNGSSYVGGLIGQNNGIIEQSAAVSEHVQGTSGSVGGLVGYNDTNGVITNSYARTNVSGNGNQGGFVGINRGEIDNCYSVGKVEGLNTKGGFAGYSDGSIDSSYYDKDVCGLSDTSKGTPRTTPQMKTKTTYVGWDFTYTWFYIVSQYPTLRVE
jgi:hypothetical protein